MRKLFSLFINNGIPIIMMFCAIGVTAMLVHREFGRPGIKKAQMTAQSDWQTYASVGHRFGPKAASVTITEFADFECPVCQKFVTGALATVRQHYPNDVAVVFSHWPHPYHRLAYPAARAAECAADQGRFEAYYEALYSHQDSLGIIPFARIAVLAGVADSQRFAKCNSRSEPVDQIEVDMRAAKALGGAGTPTILVNDMLLPGAPSEATLDSLIRKTLAAKAAAGT